ncbi:MAG: VacJ family lipoprotein [Holosporaceae bacterium]|jgi:phospholipid-binding lipoprotein MlaA|nr:VacJ family lipoprotein [Holosporaceae bacterium]
MPFVKGVVLFFLLTSCSTTRDNPDPHKEFNKDMLRLNLAVDKNVLKPASSTYKEVAPDAIRESISNFLINLKEPFHFLNYLITAEGENATNALFRFVINSIVGIFGIFDIGEQVGLEKAETSHKSTLKKYGVPTGDYLVLPLLGPSSTRDAIAEPISWFADPVGYFIGFPYMFAKAVLMIIHERAENSGMMDSMLQDSMDVYAITKNLYFQKYGVAEQDAEENLSE